MCKLSNFILRMEERINSYKTLLANKHLLSALIWTEFQRLSYASARIFRFYVIQNFIKVMQLSGDEFPNNWCKEFDFRIYWLKNNVICSENIRLRQQEIDQNNSFHSVTVNIFPTICASSMRHKNWIFLENIQQK